MRTIVKKWGNSLALRLPKSLAEQANITEDTPIEIEVTDTGLHLVPIPEPPYALHELLAGITEDNLHDASDFGGAQGNEAW